MTATKQETKQLIAKLFNSEEVVINGIKANTKDIVCLCERLKSGKEKIKSFISHLYADGKRTTYIVTLL